MSKFTALPVGQGDAFLLQRPEHSILVDGGRALQGLTPTLLSYSSIRRLSVVVCTHADADHADGLIGLLESNSVPVDEVWLPGRWTERLADLCRNPIEFVKRAWQQADEAEATDLEAFGNKLIADDSHNNVDESRSGDEEPCDTLDPAPDVTEALAAEGPWLRQSFWWWGDASSSILWQILDVAERIRRVARAAHNAGARLRWFDFDMAERSGKASGGIPGVLLPVNSAELTSRRAVSRLRELDWLALSLANKQSLVFTSPETNDHPGVLFTADSDLSFHPALPLPPQRDVLVTSPHHGSESNATAYARLATWAPTQTLVRSDGNYQTRPGKTFLRHGNRRFCTLCRGQAGKREIVFEAPAADWIAPSSGDCACR